MQEISHILSPGSLLSVTVYYGAALQPQLMKVCVPQCGLRCQSASRQRSRAPPVRCPRPGCGSPRCSCSCRCCCCSARPARCPHRPAVSHSHRHRHTRPGAGPGGAEPRAPLWPGEEQRGVFRAPLPCPAADVEREVPAGHTRGSRSSAGLRGDFPGKLRSAASGHPRTRPVPSLHPRTHRVPSPAPPNLLVPSLQTHPPAPQTRRSLLCSPVPVRLHPPAPPSPRIGADPGIPLLCLFGGALQGPGEERRGVWRFSSHASPPNNPPGAEFRGLRVLSEFGLCFQLEKNCAEKPNSDGKSVSWPGKSFLAAAAVFIQRELQAGSGDWALERSAVRVMDGEQPRKGIVSSCSKFGGYSGILRAPRSSPLR